MFIIAARRRPAPTPARTYGKARLRWFVTRSVQAPVSRLPATRLVTTMRVFPLRRIDEILESGIQAVV